jgi:hypothetical protein
VPRIPTIYPWVFGLRIPTHTQNIPMLTCCNCWIYPCIPVYTQRKTSTRIPIIPGAYSTGIRVCGWAGAAAGCKACPSERLTPVGCPGATKRHPNHRSADAKAVARQAKSGLLPPNIRAQPQDWLAFTTWCTGKRTRLAIFIQPGICGRCTENAYRLTSTKPIAYW